MNADVRTSVLSAVYALIVSDVRPAAAESDWQTAPTSSPYPATEVRGGIRRQWTRGNAPVARGRRSLRRPTRRFDSAVQPADYVPEMNDAADELPADAQFYTIDELREEMKKLAWTKGDFTIVPYGQLWGSMMYGSSRWAPGQFILYVPSADGLLGEGRGQFRNRHAENPAGHEYYRPRDSYVRGFTKSGVQVEVDFMGLAGNVVGGSVIPTGENFAGLLMRHAFAEIKTDDWRLLAGQTWDVISPLNPGMLTYAVGWAGGNIGFRRMQIRGERYWHFGDSCLVTVQGAMMQDVVADLPAFAENSNWPVLEGRLALSLAKPLTEFAPLPSVCRDTLASKAGFPIDMRNRADDYRLPTWSVCADAVRHYAAAGDSGRVLHGKEPGHVPGRRQSGHQSFTRTPSNPRAGGSICGTTGRPGCIAISVAGTMTR